MSTDRKATILAAGEALAAASRKAARASVTADSCGTETDRRRWREAEADREAAHADFIEAVNAAFNNPDERS